LILSQASSKLKAILDEVEAIHITKRQRSEGKTVCYRLRMAEFDEDPSDLNFRTLRAIVSSVSHCSHRSEHSPTLNVRICFSISRSLTPFH
jgi:hypothetical protein